MEFLGLLLIAVAFVILVVVVRQDNRRWGENP